MRRKIIFKNNTTGEEVILPVTPSKYTIDNGVTVQTVDMHAFGEYSLPSGGMKLFQAALEFMLPAKSYPFMNAGASTNPYTYISFFERAAQNKQTCRFVISDTPTVCDVWIENLQYGEQDGTNDVYCTLTMRRYRALGSAVKTVTTSSGSALYKAASTRTTVTPTTTASTYTIQSGDSLSRICKKFYGDASLYSKLATYNGIGDPNYIRAGKTIKIPAKSLLS